MINLLARTVARGSTIDKVYSMSLPPQGRGALAGAGSSRKPALTKNPKPPKKPSPKKPSTKKHNWMIKGIGALLQRVEPSQISEASVEVSSDAPFDLLCSYNWRQETKPSSIYVPGAPPRWKPPPVPVTIPRDTGVFCIDVNACHAPKYPFEPVFQALSLMNPAHNFQDTDVVTNRNSLRKLLDFVAGQACDSFRIDLHMVNNTLFLNRRERNIRETIRGSQGGFGHNFEKASTEALPGLEDSTAHHRVIAYELGGLKCAVCFEVDAHFDDDDDDDDDKEQQKPDPEPPSISDGLISSMLGGLSLQEKGEKENGSIQVSNRGYPIPSSSIAEIKSRGKSLKIQDVMPQLWLSRTPHLLCGYHKNGSFAKIEAQDCKSMFSDWGAKHQSALRKMVGLLTKLRDLTAGSGNRSCVVVYDKKLTPPALCVYSYPASRLVLPDGIVKKYWRA